MDKIVTDNSKVNINLLKENKLLKKQIKELKLDKKALEKQLSIYGVSNCGGAIPYDSLSDSFKKSIDSIEDNLNR